MVIDSVMYTEGYMNNGSVMLTMLLDGSLCSASALHSQKQRPVIF